MTDDELDRALFALPLEEPPADMHARIMSATIYRVAPTFQPWELVLLAVAVALVAGLTAYLFGTTPKPAAASTIGPWPVCTPSASSTAPRTCGWPWASRRVWWISSLPFMAPPRPTVYNR